MVKVCSNIQLFNYLLWYRIIEHWLWIMNTNVPRICGSYAPSSGFIEISRLPTSENNIPHCANIFESRITQLRITSQPPFKQILGCVAFLLSDDLFLTSSLQIWIIPPHVSVFISLWKLWNSFYRKAHVQLY